VADGALAIDWQMEGAVLQLRANLSDRPLTLSAASGRPVYGAAPDSGPCAPNTVVFSIT
jgi:maltooligosyltrehalose trehalohydrolase